MRSLTATMTLDSRLLHLYRPLARNLILIAVVTVTLAAGALIYFDERLVNDLSGRLIDAGADTTREKAQRLFERASAGVGVVQRQLATAEMTTPEGRERLFAFLAPLLQGAKYLDSINLATVAGDEYVVIKQDGEFRIRSVSAAEPRTAHWQRRNAEGAILEEWTRHLDVVAGERPWFKGAVALEPGARHWTDPYTFLTTQEPGLSVSSKWQRASDGGEYVTAFNITLTEISEYTTRNRPSANGMTVVFTDEGATIGLPPDPRFASESGILAGVLKPVGELGVAPLTAALADWEKRGRTAGSFAFSMGDGGSWWYGVHKLDLDSTHALWTVVLVPEGDLLGSVPRLRHLVLAGIAVAGLVLAAALFLTSMRKIRRQMSAAVDEVKRRLGQYQLQEKIGEGGNGAVYRARHALLRRPTAIKLMSPEFARSPAARARFEHEVQITSTLSHPNTIAIFDYGHTPDGTLYYAMEYLSGSTLDQVVRLGGPMPAGRVIHVLEQMAGSLAEAHDKGLIHRDIKPSNAILCERGGLYDVIKVLDFGLVKEIGQVDGELTQANVLIGTPLYMAPEIISKPGQGSPQSDLYALGAVGYFLLTGRNVFEGSSAVEICAAHLHDAPAPPSARTDQLVPEDLEQIILGCLAKEPVQRPVNAAALRDSLLRCRDAGTWTQQNARAWWSAHSTAFARQGSHELAEPLSKTEVLIDMNTRWGALGSTAARGPAAGQ